MALAVILLAAATVYAGVDRHWLSVSGARGDGASRWLVATVEDYRSRSWDEVVALQGDVHRVHGQAGDGHYGIDLRISQQRLDLIEIRAVLRDTDTGGRVDEIVTYRGRESR